MTGSRGRFVVLEGLDGSGTTTQTALLAERLTGLGIRVHATHEPSSGEIGLAVRRALQGTIHLTPQALALGFAADRLHHLADMDRVLGEGVHVVCDRYVLSSLAYQAADGVDVAWLAEINRAAHAPDATVFLDTSVETCVARIAGRGEAAERFDGEAALRATDAAYRRAITSGVDLGELVTVDGEKQAEDVADAIWDRLRGILEP